MDNSAIDINNQKKDPFENLPKEELMKKCKQFLGIAQKAKQAKDDLAEENKELTKKLKDIDNKSQGDVITLQEMVNVLTQQKLQLVTDYDILLKQKNAADNQAKDYREELIETKTAVESLETQLQCCRRQVTRLTEENEDLITHLNANEKEISDLTTLGELQREQLLSLEKQSKKKDVIEENSKDVPHPIDKLQVENIEQLKVKCEQLELDLMQNQSTMNEKIKMLECLHEELNSLKQKHEEMRDLKESCQLKNNEIEVLNSKVEELNSVISDLNQDISTKNGCIHSLTARTETMLDELQSTSQNLMETDSKMVILAAELENTKISKQMYNEKLKSYHTKLIKVFADVRELKQHKMNLLLIIEDYGSYIQKWQNDIKNVSHKFKEELNHCNAKVNSLQIENAELKITCDSLTLELSQKNANINSQTEATANEQLEEYRKTLSKLEAKEIVTLKLSTENVNLLKSLNEYKNEMEQMNLITETNLKLEDKLKESECNIVLLTDENVKLAGIINSLDNKLKQTEEVISVKDHLYEEKLALLNDIESKELQILHLEKEKEEFIETINANKNEIESLLNKLKESNNALTEYTALKRFEISVINKEIARLNDMVMKMHLESLDLNREKEMVDTENNKFIEILELKEQKMILLSEEIKLLLDKDEECRKLMAANKNIEQEKVGLMKKLEVKTEENILFLKEKQNLLETIETNTQEVQDIQNIKDINLNLVQENGDLLESLHKADSKIAEYQSVMDDYKIKLENVMSSKDETIEIIRKEKVNLLENISTLNEKVNEVNCELSAYKKDCSDLRSQVSISKRENAELLKEMNDMNEALKERGETISKQQECAQDLLKRIQNLEQEIHTNKQHGNKLEEENKLLKSQAAEQDVSTGREQNTLLESKNEKIKKLEQELQQHQESVGSNLGREAQDGVYGDSETMSTSTVSRLDEAVRLRDLEGSWEERYTKLRTLALKLKGKVNLLTEQLTQERNEKSEIQSKLSTTIRNLQSVQNEYDNIHDECEAVNKENKMSVKQIETLTTDNYNVKRELMLMSENVTKTQLELDNLKREKSNSETVIKQLTTQIHNLKKEIENSAAAKREIENRASKLENVLSTKEEELQKEIKAHNSAKEQLQKYDKEIKKNSVLNLEMEDYERSLKETSLKLEKKNDMVSDLEEKLDKQECLVASLKEQIGLLEEKILADETHMHELDNELRTGKGKISEYEAIISQKDNRIREIIRSLEELKSSNEEISQEMAHIVSHNQKQIEQLRNEKEHHKCQILGLEEKVRQLVTTVKDREQELLHLHTEYSNYKVRAQSVLRQNQTRDVALEERLSDEIAELKSQVEVLTTQLAEVTSQMENVTIQYGLLEKEKLENAAHCLELEKLLAKEKDENRTLTGRQQQLVEEHRESLRAQKVHTDTLAQCYKQQLAEQEDRHIKEMAELRTARNNSSMQASQVRDEGLDITSMQREEGEGSESVESTYNNNAPTKSVPLSLDKLLNMDVDNISAVDYESELSASRKQVTEYEARVSHLTDLLADAEQDLAKHAQLNQLLKEDIRRHQRSVEREKHAENLEYLKNVVFKFLTLHNGDEKSRLVPVLNTILKLSPEETQKLNSVAKGADTSLLSWGSYLPLWNTSNN